MFKTEPKGHELTPTIERPPRERFKIDVTCECGEFSRSVRAADVRIGKKNINMFYNAHLKEKGAR